MASSSLSYVAPEVVFPDAQYIPFRTTAVASKRKYPLWVQSGTQDGSGTDFSPKTLLRGSRCVSDLKFRAATLTYMLVSSSRTILMCNICEGFETSCESRVIRSDSSETLRNIDLSVIKGSRKQHFLKIRQEYDDSSNSAHLLCPKVVFDLKIDFSSNMFPICMNGHCQSEQDRLFESCRRN